MTLPTLLTINNYYYRRGGAEAVYFEHNQLFAALGWTVIPFAMKHANNLPTPWSTYFVEEIEFGEEYSLPGKIARIPKVIYSLEARRNLMRLLDHARVDLCHAHNVYHHISPSIFGLLHSRGIPTVLTLHDLKIVCPAYNMLTHDGICERCRGGKLHNVVLNRCIKQSVGLSTVVMIEAILHRLLGTYRHCVTRFVVPSRFYVEKFCDWGMPGSLFSYVPNFIDPALYRPEFLPGKTFVYFGRVSREKGLRTLVRAAAAAKCQLSIVGTGPQIAELRALAEHLNVEVAFHGHLGAEALHNVVRGARAVVLASEWYENAPVSILEAYGLGKPLIGARIGGIPELVRENETGVTFRSGDEAALVAALRNMAERPDREIEAMGRLGRQWVEETFTAAQYLERMLEIYRDAGISMPGVHGTAAHL